MIELPEKLNFWLTWAAFAIGPLLLIYFIVFLRIYFTDDDAEREINQWFWWGFFPGIVTSVAGVIFYSVDGVPEPLMRALSGGELFVLSMAIGLGIFGQGFFGETSPSLRVNGTIGVFCAILIAFGYPLLQDPDDPSILLAVTSASLFLFLSVIGAQTVGEKARVDRKARDFEVRQVERDTARDSASAVVGVLAYFIASHRAQLLLDSIDNGYFEQIADHLSNLHQERSVQLSELLSALSEDDLARFHLYLRNNYDYLDSSRVTALAALPQEYRDFFIRVENDILDAEYKLGDELIMASENRRL